MESEELCKGDRMLTFELEAAEALAGLAWTSLHGEFLRPRGQLIDTEAVVISSQRSQCQALGGQQFSRKTSTMVAGHTNTSNIETTPKQALNISNQSKVPGTVRHNLTEVEKQAQKLRRVLANRESARQTIRRRQAMYLELTGKEAKLSTENTYLKQERELAVKEYNYLKDKNEFLKAQMAKTKRAEPGHIHDTPASSRAEKSSSSTATTATCLHNRLPLAPLFLPFNLQCASDTDFTNVSQFRAPVCDESYLSQGQECSTALTKPRPPFVILQVPWLLPFLSPNGKLEFHHTTKDQQHKPPPILQCSECSSLSILAHGDTGAGMYNSTRVIPTSNGIGARFHHPPDYMSSFSGKNHRGQLISSSKKPENIGIAATEARRKRREVMKLKNAHSPDAHIQ